MQQHNLIQGSPEWHEHRRIHFNASDAPAMLGFSKYKSRTKLLHETFTGIFDEVDAATQKRFDDGHRFEALARPLAEEIIGKSLYPIVGSEGKLSASFDGITIMEDIAFEHKSLNAEIRSCVDIGDLSVMYKIQMQQQLMVSGAEKCLFMATSWDENDQLIDSKHFWFTGDAEIAHDILQGWTQFAVDLENYVPTEVIEKPKAAAIMALPSLAIAIKGEVTASNLAEFKEATTVFISNIKTELVTDQDFADAESMTKFLDVAEKDIEAAKTSAIAQTASIDELMRTMDFIKAQLRDKRLALKKLVESEKENRKLQIVRNVQDKFNATLRDLSAEIFPVNLIYPAFHFADALKNKKTLASMEDSADTMRAEKESMLNQIAKDIRAKLTWYREAADGYFALFADLQQIIYKPMDDFKLLVNSRIDAHKKTEAERDAKIKSDVEAAALLKLEANKAKPSEKVKPEESHVEEALTMVENKATNLRAAVVEQQDVIASFFKTRDFNQHKENEYRAVIVEFIKHQEATKLKIAA